MTKPRRQPASPPSLSDHGPATTARARNTRLQPVFGDINGNTQRVSDPPLKVLSRPDRNRKAPAITKRQYDAGMAYVDAYEALNSGGATSFEGRCDGGGAADGPSYRHLKAAQTLYRMTAGLLPIERRELERVLEREEYPSNVELLRQGLDALNVQ